MSGWHPHSFALGLTQGTTARHCICLGICISTQERYEMAWQAAEGQVPVDSVGHPLKVFAAVSASRLACRTPIEASMRRSWCTANARKLIVFTASEAMTYNG